MANTHAVFIRIFVLILVSQDAFFSLLLTVTTAVYSFKLLDKYDWWTAKMQKKSRYNNSSSVQVVWSQYELIQNIRPL